MAAAEKAWDSAPAESKSKVLRQVVELGGVLGGLVPGLATLLRAHHDCPKFWDIADVHYLSACTTVQTCCEVASLPGPALTGSDAFRFAQCGRLLFGIGRQVLGEWLDCAAQYGQRRHLLKRMAAGMTWEQVADMGVEYLEPQLKAVQALLHFLRAPGQERTLAAFAATVAAPDESLRWLLAAASVLEVCRQSGLQSMIQPLMPAYANICAQLVSAAAFFKHQAALQASPQHQQQLMSLLPLLLEKAAESLVAQDESMGNTSSGASGSSSAGASGTIGSSTAGGSGSCHSSSTGADGSGGGGGGGGSNRGRGSIGIGGGSSSASASASASASGSGGTSAGGTAGGSDDTDYVSSFQRATKHLDRDQLIALAALMREDRSKKTAGFVWQLVGHVLQLAAAPCLQAGVQEQLRANMPQAGPGSGQAGLPPRLLQLLGSILEQLPLQRPPGLAASQHGLLLMDALLAVGQVYDLAFQAAAGEELRAGTCQASMSIMPALAARACCLLEDTELAAMLAGQPAARVAALCGSMQQFLRLVLSACESCTASAAAAEPTATAWQGVAQNMLGFGSAVHAALQLYQFSAQLPLLMQQADSGSAAEAAASLSKNALAVCVAAAVAVLRTLRPVVPGGPAPDSARSQVLGELAQAQFPRLLRQAHATCCRLLYHSMGSGQQPAAAAAATGSKAAPVFLGCARLLFQSATGLGTMEEGGLFTERQLQCLGMAQAEAELAVSACHTDQPSGSPLKQTAPDELADRTVHEALRHLSAAYKTDAVPFGKQAPARQAALSLLHHRVQALASNPTEAAWEECCRFFEMAAGSPQLAACFLSSGMLTDLLKALLEAASFSPATLPEAQGAFGQLLDATEGLVELVYGAFLLQESISSHSSVSQAGMHTSSIAAATRTVCSTAGNVQGGDLASPAGSNTAAALVQQLKQAGDELPAAPLEHCNEDIPPEALIRAYLTQSEPAARRLAAALEALWELPQQQAARRLHLAQAAATRSCAYLRCANLHARGGPDAGEGVGSKKCSACRAVWYCGTACSHADWRVGHKLVCKALAAQRQGGEELQRI